MQAAYDGDPAATNLDEVVLAYPGLLAVSVYRIAHALYDLGVPMMARIMTEWAHSKTGCRHSSGSEDRCGVLHRSCDGRRDRRDHRYRRRGETLPGRDPRAHLSFPRDATGHVIRGKKRHPTVESGATLYANATVLGGRRRRRRQQRHRRLGVPDAQRAAALACIAEGAGAARVEPRRRGRTRRALLRHLKGAPPTGGAAAAGQGVRAYIIFASTGTISSATMLMILMSGLMAGPAVSL